MSNAWENLDPRFRMISVAVIAVALFGLAWWAAGSLGLIEAGSDDADGTVAIEPTLQNLTVLAVIVAIRTFLSFALELEVSGRWPWQRAQDVVQRPGGAS